jgi:hypothetical protein
MENKANQPKTCSICQESTTSYIHQEKNWTVYQSDFFGDQTHNYVFCDHCLHDLIQGNPLKGPLRRYIDGDPSYCWNMPDPRKLEKNEREKLTKKFEEQLISIQEDALL